jgi:hypothetical protein
MSLGKVFENGLLWLESKTYTGASVSTSANQTVSSEASTQETQNANTAAQTVEATPIAPLMDKANVSSMMPYLEVRMPGIFDSFFLPYENLVDFSYSVFAGSATLSFVDNTPIFIETVLREMWSLRGNEEKGQTARIEISFGWRSQNPPFNIASRENKPDYSRSFSQDGKRQASSSDNFGVLSTPFLEFLFIDGTYESTTSGFLTTLSLACAPINVLDTVTVNKIQKLNNITDDESLTNELERVLKATVVNTDKVFKVNVVAKNIDYTKLNSPEISFKGDETVRHFLNTVINQLSIPIKDKTKQDSSVLIAVGEIIPPHEELSLAQVAEQTGLPESIIKERRAQDDEFGKSIVPIYIYNKDQQPDGANNIPLIEYPANESPVLEFSPSLEGSLSTMFASTQSYTDFDGKGNIVNKVLPFPLSGPRGWNEPITDGIQIPVGGTVTTGPPVPISDGESQNFPRSAVMQAKLSVKLLGDPVFTTRDLAMNTIEVRMNNIANTGMFKDTDDFFNNFNQLPSLIDTYNLKDENGNPLTESNLANMGVSKRGRGFPLISSYIPGDTSPFNGFYKINEIRQKISITEGFVTELDLILFEDKL